MDSLTQIILGAAVGEIALGKKIGNRAMIWGGIGGTIPDLDVIANSILPPIDALAFHRGITHSILFSVVAPVFFGWIVHQSYQRNFHKSWPYKLIVTVLNAAIVISLLWGINYLFRQDGQIRWWLLMITGAGALYLLWRLYKYYVIKDLEIITTTFKDWYWLFFLAFSTHWLLDCFTAFGTQIFYPFSKWRVAFNNIAVADPFYTVPFLIFIIIAAFFKRNTGRRRLFLWLGIGISSLYMAMTIYNKIRVDRIFDQAIQNRHLDVSRCHCSPTILNNILWACVAEGPDEYYAGRYSLFDSDPNLHYLNTIPKNDSLHQTLMPYKDYQTLWWFSDGYLVSFPTDSVTYLSDIRYGGMTDTIRGPHDLVFNFLVREENGKMVFDESRERPQGSFGDLLKDFIERIKGY